MRPYVFDVLVLKLLLSFYVSNNETVNVRVNVTSRHVRVTTIVVQMQQVLHIPSQCL